MTVLDNPLLLAFPLAMAFAAASDLLTMTIPNKISLALIALFVVAAALTGMPMQLFLTHLAVGAAVLVVGFILFATRIVGGGDAKLMAAAALWLGLDWMTEFFVYIALFGGVLAVAILLYRHLIPEAMASFAPWAARLHAAGTGIPYGIAISASALVIYPSTIWFATLGG
ncbi:MAG: A24 family peptidase [Hyphomicrobium sp.]